MLTRGRKSKPDKQLYQIAHVGSVSVHHYENKQSM